MNSIKRAWEQLTPDNETKSRMRARLLAAGAQLDGERESFPVKNRPSRRPVYIVAGIGALCACLTVALAATYYFGSAKYKGKYRSEERTGTTSAPIANTGEMTIEDYANEILSEQPRNELWYISVGEHKGTFMEPTEEVTSFDQLCDRVGAAYVEIYLPTALPNGYSFVEGWVSFYTQIETLSIEKLGQETVETPQGEVTKHMYSLERRDLNTISGYYMLLKNEAGEELSIYAHMEETLDSEVGKDDGDISQSLDIFSMDEAVYVGSSETGTIFARRVFPFGVKYFDLMRLFAYGENTEGEYLCTNYQLRAENRDMQQLRALFDEAFNSAFPSAVPSSPITPTPRFEPSVTPDP